MSKAKQKKASEVAPEDLEGGKADESSDAEKKGEESRINIQGDSDNEVELRTETEESIEDEGGDELASLRAEVSSLQDQLLRKQADFENFRKRIMREREDAIRYANANLLLDLVEVVDNFERAIKSSEDSQDFSSFHEGVELIEKQFTGMLESKWGLKRFDSVGEEFDPEKHEAIAAEEREGEQIVLEDFQKGYFLHDRVLRHAKVKVSLPRSTRDTNKDEDEGEQDDGDAELDD